MANATGILELYVDDVLTHPITAPPLTVVNGSRIEARLNTGTLALFSDAAFVDMVRSCWLEDPTRRDRCMAGHCSQPG